MQSAVAACRRYHRSFPVVTAVAAVGSPPGKETGAGAPRRAPARLLGQRFVVEDDGQELVEYGLLTLLIMAVGVAVFVAIQVGMGEAYSAWGAAIVNNWQPSAPAP